MTIEDFQHVKKDDILIEGSNHPVIVQQVLGNPQDRIVYYERGFHHEVMYDYLSFPLTVS